MRAADERGEAGVVDPVGRLQVWPLESAGATSGPLPGATWAVAEVTSSGLESMSFG